MRVTHLLLLGSATALLTVPGVAHAKAKSKPAPAVVDTAPTDSAAQRAARLAMADDTGSLRDNQLSGVAIETVASGPEAVATERGPANAANPVRSDQPLSGAMSELVDKRMAQNGAFTAALDACVTSARARNPHLGGVLSISVRVVGKAASVEIASAAAGDTQLISCLSATRGKLALPDLSFPWQLSLGTTNGGEMATR
jgi:hypothetical protein